MVEEAAQELAAGKITEAELLRKARSEAGYNGLRSRFQQWVTDAKQRVAYESGDALAVWRARWARNGVSSELLAMLQGKAEDLANGQQQITSLWRTAQEPPYGYSAGRKHFAKMFHDLLEAWTFNRDRAVGGGSGYPDAAFVNGPGVSSAPEGREVGGASVSR
jgi:hypothetical protein